MADGQGDVPRDEELLALQNLDAQLWSGQEWEYVAVEPEDLGFPASMSSYEIEQWSYSSGLEEVGRTSEANDQTVIECKFFVQLSVRATMATADVDPAWELISQSKDEAEIRALLEMEGRVGL